MLGNNMFAYCRNNPVKRKDATGTEDICVTDGEDDDSPFDDVGVSHGGGGISGGNSSSETGSGAGSSSGAGGGYVDNTPIPPAATETLKYIDQHGHAPHGYKGGSIFQNDGRDGGQVLPPSGMPYREFDIYPHTKGIPRGPERIVLGNDGSAWYTPNHYSTFSRMR